ncbi:hypothetical protein Bca4012_076415 [Brassica carinata]|uniref:(rape) hypothetical protein n=1 Tax=Brassica napus TaxID=3708 RepID=A0A078I927_BRANA|nr:unnamed protein product [Brassica napus]CDY46582.1 BnaCnng14040D [Brassica napus]
MDDVHHNSLGAYANVTFRVHGIFGSRQTHEAPSGALVIVALVEDDHLFDDTMADANGNDFMAMEDDELLGDELQTYHPMEEEDNNAHGDA